MQSNNDWAGGFENDPRIILAPLECCAVSVFLSGQLVPQSGCDPSSRGIVTSRHVKRRRQIHLACSASRGAQRKWGGGRYVFVKKKSHDQWRV